MILSWFRRRRGRPAQIWRYLRTAGRLVYRRPLLSVTVIPLLRDDRIVLICRVDNRLWSLPGGIVEWGETIRDTARRELLEETGLRIVETLGLQGVYSRPDRDPRTHAASVSIIARVAGQDGAVDALEVSDVRAFAPDELPYDQMAHDHARQLRDYLGGRTVID